MSQPPTPAEVAFRQWAAVQSWPHADCLCAERAFLTAYIYGQEAERRRAVRYLETLCWSAEEIAAFLRWMGTP